MTNINEDTTEELAIVDEPFPIPPEVFTDKGGEMRWQRQEVLLERYSKRGNVTAGCLAAGISYRTHTRWLEGNIYSYRERFRLAHRQYVDGLEEMVQDRLDSPSGNRGSDVLLIARLNKEDPDAWRGNTVKIDLPDQLLAYMQKRQAEDAKALPVGDESRVIEHRPSDAKPPWES